MENTTLIEMPLDDTEPGDFNAQIMEGLNQGLTPHEARKQAMRMYSYSE